MSTYAIVRAPTDGRGWTHREVITMHMEGVGARGWAGVERLGCGYSSSNVLWYEVVHRCHSQWHCPITRHCRRGVRSVVRHCRDWDDRRGDE